jgi:hypothetical protein
MKKLLSILFLFPLFAIAQNPNYYGTTYNNQTIVLPANSTYSGGTFGGFQNVTIDLNGAKFSGTVHMGPFNNVIIKNGKWDAASTCIDVVGNWSFVTEQDCNFRNSGIIHAANDNGSMYDGTQGSLKSYRVSYLRDTADHSDLFIQGTYASGWQPICYNDSTLVSNCVFLNTASNGTEVRGSFFHMGFKNNRIIYTDNNGLNTVLGDVGVLYISGSVVCVNNYMRGGRGYISREWHCGLGSTAAISWYMNNIRVSTETYGTFDTRDTEQDGVYITRGGIMYVINNTAVNQRDNINFWSPKNVVGQLGGTPVTRVINRFNLGAAFTLRGKTPMVVNQSNGTWVNSDSSNNIYFDDPAGKIDTVTGGKLVTFTGVGATPTGGNSAPLLSVFPSGVTTITAPISSVNFTSNASDPDGTVTTYAWTKTDGPGAVTFSTTTASATNASFSTFGTYIIRETVTDNSGNQTTSDQTVVYNASSNQPPTIQVSSMNPNAVYLPVDSVVIRSLAGDVDGTITSDTWTVVSVPAGASNPGSYGSGNRITFTGLVAGTYSFQRTVSDNNGASTTALVQIQVNAVISNNNNRLILPGGGGQIIFK